MSIIQKTKDALTSTTQKALGIDGIRFNLQVALERLERIYELESKITELQSRNASIDARTASIDARTASTGDQIQNLKNFLTWYSNRVEPWFWTGNFSHADPEEELAGLLFNFLPGSVLLTVGAENSNFTKAAAEVGYEVHYLEPQNYAALPGVKTSSDKIDFVNITRENVDVGLLRALDSIQPSVIQIAFADDNALTAHDRVQQKTPVSTPEIIKELRKQGYYWNVTIFRTEVESFIRMGTNLASVPDKAWGTIVFFRDQQLFLKAFHWCKTTLPRYRAAPLA
jgi:hypothetical protein